MTKQERTAYDQSSVMNEARLEDELKALVREFGGGTSLQYNKRANQAQDSQKQLQKSVDSLRESLDYLRVCIKYQLFDLEATRRENKYLREMLEENDR